MGVIYRKGAIHKTPPVTRESAVKLITNGLMDTLEEYRDNLDKVEELARAISEIIQHGYADILFLGETIQIEEEW